MCFQHALTQIIMIRQFFSSLIVVVIASMSSLAIEKPNIIFVLLDDMAYGEPACYRPTSLFKTPNMDRVAREGIRFTDAHSSASNCTPTRYGFLTGRYPHRIGQFSVLSTFFTAADPRDSPDCSVISETKRLCNCVHWKMASWDELEQV
jgi:hypothetical protein